MSISSPIFPQVLEHLGIVVLAHQGNGSFQVMGPIPDWFRLLIPASGQPENGIEVATVLPFLENFVSDAQQHWQNGQQDPLHSGLWVELSPMGQEIPLEASALYFEPFQLLLIHQSLTAYRLHRHFLQKGRENVLTALQNSKQVAQQLHSSTFYDWLTGLPNEAFLQLSLSQQLEEIQRDEAPPFFLFLLHIEHFKTINSKHGKTFGNLVLMEIIARLQEALDSEDLLARLGGVDFVFIPKRIQEIGQAQAFADQINQVLSSPYLIEKKEVGLSLSIGIAGASKNQQPDELLEQANLAKDFTQNQDNQAFALFDDQMRMEILRQTNLEKDLSLAVRYHQLRAYYEPIVSLPEHRVIGFEALIRWEHPVYGLLAPRDFIPLAKKTGLVLPLGQWILSEACAQLVTWKTKLKRPLAIQVNLSAQQLEHPELLALVETILQEMPLWPRDIKLEITEGMIQNDLDAMVERLNQIKSTGVQLCMDDFGTGYSSLSYLRRLPVDTLKIDRSLVQAESQGSTEILQAMITLAHNLNMNVIAEGVETETHLKRIEGLGCDQAQGYLFSKAVSADLAETLLS